MKLRSTLLLLFAIAASSIAALAAKPAVSVDLNSIGVSVSMHPEQLRALTERFEQGDTTLTMQEVATVYYGYSFTPNYQPDERYPEIAQAYEDKDYAKTASMVKEAMKVNPVSLDLIVFGALSSPKLHTDEGRADALLFRRKLDMLVDMIFATGTGISPESPFYVICDSDIERLLRNIIGVGDILGESGIGNLDAYKFTFAGSPRENILYFNNSRQHDYEAHK